MSSGKIVKTSIRTGLRTGRRGNLEPRPSQSKRMSQRSFDEAVWNVDNNPPGFVLDDEDEGNEPSAFELE